VCNLLSKLEPKARRGSKPRCHWVTQGDPTSVAAALTELMTPFGVVEADDSWMPLGFEDTKEAELDKASTLLNPDIRRGLSDWWLAPASKQAMTPNFDIASTCTIDGKAGLLLVEAKAHDEELKKESAGRRLTANSSEGRRLSHEKIGLAISEACQGLEESTRLPWNISRDTHYQVSNRFAWAWKLTELGIPVALVYLGFLNADEMKDRGSVFPDAKVWEQLVKSHTETLFPKEIWGRKWMVNGLPFISLIHSVEVPLDG